MRVAIITGATGGIGSEFCRALDDQNLDAMFILGRNVESLRTVAEELQTHVCITTMDLSDRRALQDFCESLSKQDLDVRFLVNCAGFGTFGELSEQNGGDTTGMVDVNIIALTELSRVCIPMMGRGSNIIQVCSASAYLPLPGLGVYAATKAYVRSFTESLRMELKDKGINVLEVSPGWVDTAFIDNAVESHSVPKKVFKHKVQPHDVVAQAMVDLKRGKNRSICGSYNKLQVFVCRHIPRIATYVWMRSLR